jgi:DNA-binding GntR family transcriptional regulator
MPVPHKLPSPKSFFSLGEYAYQTLRESILSGQIAPGERITEQELADQLRISRTPVREAIFRLRSEELIIEGQRGLEVGQVTAEFAYDVYIVREVLDGLAARLACLNATELELEQLRLHVQRLDKAIQDEDREAGMVANREFHLLLYKASRNKVLQTYGENITGLLARFPEWRESYDERKVEVSQEHSVMAEAIAARDCERVEALAQAHIEKSRKGLLRHLAVRSSAT